jgi:hypothetical protein
VSCLGAKSTDSGFFILLGVSQTLLTFVWACCYACAWLLLEIVSIPINSATPDVAISKAKTRDFCESPLLFAINIKCITKHNYLMCC